MDSSEQAKSLRAIFNYKAMIQVEENLEKLDYIFNFDQKELLQHLKATNKGKTKRMFGQLKRIDAVLTALEQDSKEDQDKNDLYLSFLRYKFQITWNFYNSVFLFL